LLVKPGPHGKPYKVFEQMPFDELFRR